MTPYTLSLRHTPAILARIVSTVPADRHREPLGQDRFSLVEMVAHVADSENVYSERLRGAVEQDVPTFEPIDVAERARAGRFSERDVQQELRMFADRRRETVAFLEGLPPEAWAREFVSRIGRVSVETFVAFISGHDLYHLDQASAYLEVDHGKA